MAGLLQDLPEFMVLEEERERLERNHERFAELLEQIGRRTEELQLLQRLTELRLREIEEQAAQVRCLRLIRQDDVSTYGDDKLHESVIRSDAFGKCTICLDEEPLDPVGCIYCQQLVGCRRCVNRWFLPARFGRSNHGQCPLCRHEWLDQAEVMCMFFLKSDPS